MQPRDSTAERCVFVGNIPYDATEDELRQLFEVVGPVVSFRLVRDRDSQKPKGYGFCEYREKDYARCAIRNMNEIEFKGRSLRVDYSEKHRVLLSMPESAKQTKTLQDSLSSLNPQEASFLLSLLQRFSQTHEEELYRVLKARPYILFSLLKLMHRLNRDLKDSRREGLLPLPEEVPQFLPNFFHMRPY